MKPILEIRNISKTFRILHNRQPYLSLRDSLTSVFKSGNSTYEEFHALNNVSFNIDQGESIGIIGKNGAGKSTLLKILSKITPPSSGSILSRGRIASLLEVGTGFHPELSGRENVFLNGSILGMKQKEIKAKFDEIVEFSGTENFLDTPLKHFSSGMQLRLAFAVAAFLEPEILVIDEVLAVGDVEFQKKCMGKIEDVGKSGRTILFVSHNMGAVMKLCSRSILLNDGKLVEDGDTGKVISEYYALNETLAEHVILSDRKDRQGNGKCKFQKVWFTDRNRKIITSFNSGDYVNIHAFVNSDSDAALSLFVSVSFCNNAGERLLSLGSGLLGKKVVIKGPTEIVWGINKLPLTADDYYGELFLFEANNMYDNVERAFKFNVNEGDYHGFGHMQTRKRDMFLVDFDVNYINT